MTKWEMAEEKGEGKNKGRKGGEQWMKREKDRKEEQGRSQAGSQRVGSAQPHWPKPGPHLLFRILEGNHQHHVPGLEL